MLKQFDKGIVICILLLVSTSVLEKNGFCHKRLICDSVKKNGDSCYGEEKAYYGDRNFQYPMVGKVFLFPIQRTLASYFVCKGSRYVTSYRSLNSNPIVIPFIQNNSVHIDQSTRFSSLHVSSLKRKDKKLPAQSTRHRELY